MNRRLPFLLFTLVVLSLTTQAQSLDKAKMDSLFARIEANQKGMGSLSIMQDGKEVYRKSIGYADLNKEKRATANTKYRIGSISKTFTATIIMQMVEEGKLNLQDKLDSFFPQIPTADQITIEHLLRHRSGLFNFTNDPDYLRWMEAPKTRDELINLFTENGSEFSPGSRMAYSNTNYVLLSLIAEKIDGSTYADILNTRIVKPLNLQNTYYGGTINTRENEAQSYTALNGWQPATETHLSIPLGAGGIVSNPADLNTFMTALFQHKLISPESVQLMKTTVEGYGLGMFEIPFNDKKGYGHNGGIDGFRSIAAYFPEQKLAISYCANGEAMPINDIIIGVLSIYFGNDYELPAFSTYAVTSEELNPYIGLYSSPNFPLKITISKEQATLIAQATGQPSFPLEATAKDKFKFDAAKLTIEFKPAEDKLILRQGGGMYELTKEKTAKNDQ